MAGAEGVRDHEIGGATFCLTGHGTGGEFLKISLSIMRSHLNRKFCGPHYIFTTVVIPAWSPDQQHQYHLKTCKKWRVSDPPWT